MTGPNALRDRHIDEIDQIVLDTAAAELYPRANPATRNREFYTPVAAVLHHAGVQTRFKRPKGWRGNKATSWLEPEQAFALFAAADKLDPEFALFCRFLLYTGMRLGEALKVRLGHLDLKRQFLYLPETKNKQPRAVYLPPVLVAALAAQPPRPVRPTAEPGVRLPNGVAGRSQADAGVSFLERHNEATLFRFRAGGRLRALLAQPWPKPGSLSPRDNAAFTCSAIPTGPGCTATAAWTRSG
jgi:integrase